ncbi:TatD family hydrolase [Entomobacter blattae]|uniref:Putative metal-dependent hydrolase YcfH n=1 Tax=Entomobacter blattae TaxID=2762277 RepID=A0A7H1NT13_9PROT|nr:TatD family hydrolase [Entomobacter blattae]QNT78923.1 putative metal-dependent hydrolase YcfH [Entomobacter blattae]
MLIDSHCHLDHFSPEELPQLLANAQEAGLEGVVTIGTRLSEASRQIALAGHSQGMKIWCSVGTHPDHAQETPDFSVKDIIALTQENTVIGIGECGLDYFHSGPEAYLKQEEVFRCHIDAARQTGLPVIIHSRNADTDMARILQEETREKGAFPFLLHCFSSGADLAETAIALGGYISFSGILTFPKAQVLRDIAKHIPHERVLVETDSPYLAPVPKRGQRNEPAYVAHTARILAKTLEISFEEVQTLTTDNFFNLFKKARS